ncbi:hypothetical protein PsAD2_04085 [Pseudovibrio axinellae]|uniref:Oxidoreductase n=1 Tax=Pseudovibrio axinellae TaxID=989403 RepID=A0A165U2A5_9HYPH|nr:DUF934 domain-containing protein [Pseudovibrio axinellae]KZL09483.1 hypothetical protein PsAD2_04085 [Pseudovibrio axinellae]SEQ63434.1 phosphoadenosine phosphosulfate reductase [Pseudovibrio axinellae]
MTTELNKTAEVFKDGKIETDVWRYITDDEELPANGKLIFSLERFLQKEQELKKTNTVLGVVLRAGEKAEALKDHLDTLELVAVDFPSFADGRSFSAARILRDTLGYAGEIRAVGPFILDQIGFMARCGINSYALDNPRLKADLVAGNLNEVTAYTQPVFARKEAPAGTRPWARRPV